VRGVTFGAGSSAALEPASAVSPLAGSIPDAEWRDDAPLRVAGHERGQTRVRQGEQVEAGLRSWPAEAFGELKAGCRYPRRCTCPCLRAATT